MKVFFALFLALILAGCGAQPAPVDDSAAREEIAASLQAYREVLADEKTVCVETSREEAFFSALMEEAVAVANYAILDMDGDAIPEVVLQMRYHTNDTYEFRVLHYEDGMVYLFNFPYRGLNGLRSDGTFTWANAASNHGIARMDFVAGMYTRTDLAYCKSDDELNMYYYIGGIDVSQEDFTIFQLQQEQKPSAGWIAYTSEAFAESIASLTAEPTA